MSSGIKDDSNVATCVNYDVASFFLIGLNLYVMPKQALQKVEGPQRQLSPFDGETP